MLFSNKNIVILCLFLLLLNGVFAYDFGRINVNYNNENEICNFNINKVENYTYYLTFEHYGNINKTMKVEIYLNGNLIYTIEGDNRGFPFDKNNVSIDVTNYLNNGSNTLRVEGINFVPGRYYVLDNIHINEPLTIKVPISITQVMIYTIATVFVGIRYLKSIKT